MREGNKSSFQQNPHVCNHISLLPGERKEAATPQPLSFALGLCVLLTCLWGSSWVYKAAHTHRGDAVSLLCHITAVRIGLCIQMVCQGLFYCCYLGVSSHPSLPRGVCRQLIAHVY